MLLNEPASRAPRKAGTATRWASLTLLLSLAAVVGVLFNPGTARASVAVYCDVNGLGGFVACAHNPCTDSETAKAFHASGLPYKFRLMDHNNPSNILGSWQWNDFNYHTVPVFFFNVMRASVDNLGNGSPSRYYVELINHNTCV